MALHGLASVTIGVPDVAGTAAYYTDFGLRPDDDGWLSTTEGGRQLKLVPRRHRTLVEMVVRAENRDDIARVAASLARLGIPVDLDPIGDSVSAIEPTVGTRVIVRVLPHLVELEVPRVTLNGPGRVERSNLRAPGILRDGTVRPHRLGHAVVGTTNFQATKAFYVDGIGFKVSDFITDQGAFLRCSNEHHNLLVLSAPVTFLHHTSWEVDDVDEIGRGAHQMLDEHPERHIWGLGRHYAGSNFFWYFKDPAGNFSEYFADMDCNIDDQLWKPEVFDGVKGLYSWGPPPPPSFMNPDDLAELMAESHSG